MKIVRTREMRNVPMKKMNDEGDPEYSSFEMLAELSISSKCFTSFQHPIMGLCRISDLSGASLCHELRRSRFDRLRLANWGQRI
jgi:hypothetical protein